MLALSTPEHMDVCVWMCTVYVYTVYTYVCIYDNMYSLEVYVNIIQSYKTTT